MGDVAIAAGIIYGIVGVVKKELPQVSGRYAFLLNLAIGIVLGYFNLFGLSGIESGVVASLVSTGANNLVGKIGK